MTVDYHAPSSVGEALELLERYGDDAHLIAGGTATVLLMRQGLLRPGHLIGLREISELGGISPTPDGGLRIGAMATHCSVERSSDAYAYSPALVDAFASVATVRIRNQATVGGNLAHADPAHDPPPMLAALDGRVTVRSTRGERSLPVEDLAVDHFTTSLAHDEVITHVVLPPTPKGTRAAYLKFLPQTTDDYATVSVAVSLRFAEDGTIADVRLVLGAVGPTPMRLRKVEDAMRGQAVDRVDDAIAMVPEEVEPLDDVRGSAHYKREMARVLTARALARLTA